ncbi:MAG: DUF362 domain-containing protein [Candidatus Alkanophagales archaeon]
MRAGTSVYLRKTQHRTSFVKEFLALHEEMLLGASRILLKPNIVSYEEYPTTTHPEVLRSCLEFLHELFGGRDGAPEIVVADGPAPDAGDSQKILEEHPLRGVCDEFGVPLVDLLRSRMRRVRGRTMSFRIAEQAFTFDLIISLPVLKAHRVTTLTGALKNQFGFFSKRDRVLFHMKIGRRRLKDIHRGIAEVNTVVRPKIFIVDAVRTLVNANERRHGGVVADLGYMLAGTHPVALDTVGFSLLKRVMRVEGAGVAEDVPHIRYSAELLGTPRAEIVEL